MRKSFVTLTLFAVALLLAAGVPPEGKDARLAKASRAAARNGWIPVHLEGTPSEIGYQHGYLLRDEIEDNFHATQVLLLHDKGPWSYYREAAEKVFWPHVDEEYRQEIDGIVEGLGPKGRELDRWDIVALNAFIEFGYYNRWLNKNGTPKANADRCSAFVATGSYTRPTAAW